jgi:hypothetical protein
MPQPRLLTNGRAPGDVVSNPEWIEQHDVHNQQPWFADTAENVIGELLIFEPSRKRNVT